jgi:hypothetical protein
MLLTSLSRRAIAGQRGLKGPGERAVAAPCSANNATTLKVSAGEVSIFRKPDVLVLSAESERRLDAGASQAAGRTQPTMAMYCAVAAAMTRTWKIS